MVRKQECPARPVREGELHASRKNGGDLRSLEFASHPAARAPGHPVRMRGNFSQFSAIGVWS